MEIVLTALFGVLILAAVFWLSALASASAADRKEHDRHDAEAARQARIIERERRMRRESIPLHCAACDAAFAGPITDVGCPRCRSGALVVPEDEYREIKARNAFGGQASSPGSEQIWRAEGYCGNDTSDRQ